MQNNSKLVQQAQAGDHEAFGELVRYYQEFVYACAYHLLKDFTEAEDATQEAFLEAYIGLPRLQNPEKFSSWLRQITHNHCIDRLRCRREFIPYEEGSEAIVNHEHYTESYGSGEMIQDALTRIPENNRLAIELYYVSGKSYKEIADFLGVPVSTVEGRLFRAKKQLREVLTMVKEGLESKRLDESLTKKVLERVKAIPAIQWWHPFDIIKHFGYNGRIFQAILKNPNIPAPSPQEYTAIKEQAWEAVKASIDNGIPAIAWQPMTVEQNRQGINAYEWAALIGYDLDERTYSVRHSRAGEFTVPFDGFGFTDPVNWFCIIILNTIDEYNQVAEKMMLIADGSGIEGLHSHSESKS